VGPRLRRGSGALALVTLVGLTVAVAGAGCGRKIPYHIERQYSVADPAFVRTMGNLLGPPILEGNKVTTLVNGDQIVPAMLEAIRSARETVNFETFVYWSGKTGNEFTDALCERARAGVAVHVIVDFIGSSRIDRGYFKRLNDAGVHLHVYHALKFYDITSAHRVNYRTHRKLLIVDGRVGFTGGVGIADEWRGDAQSPKQWRDTHYRIDGPAVAQLQAAFIDNWMETTGRVLHGEKFFPPLAPAGDVPAQVFKSSSEGGSDSMQLMYLLSIAAAQDHVRLATAYFVPDRRTIDALLDARRRGVSVQIIVPGKHIDEKFVRRASRATWGDMLKAGVEIYEYQPTMYHTKLMIVDDRWASIGSSNLDNRSFRLNDEANLNVLDVRFAAEQRAMFEQDLARSKQVTYEQWTKRPWHEKLAEEFAAMFGPQL
jgi:cardiolipin synthase